MKISKNYNIFINESRKPIGYWTIDKLQEEADKYENRKEFREKCNSAYIAASKIKLIDDLFKNHINKGYEEGKMTIGHWNREKLQEEANKHKTRGEFRKNKSAYSAALSKKLIDELFKNHSNNGFDIKVNKKGYWTFDRLQEEANKYITRGEFQKKSTGYKIAYKNRLIDELFKNHDNQGRRNIIEWKENSYVIYVYEFTNYNNAYVGLTNNINRRDKEHLFSEKESLINFCKINNIPLPKYKLLEENLNSNDAIKKEIYWVDVYENNEWIMINSVKAGSLGSGGLKWTIKSLQEEANKYKTRKEFRENSSAYIAAKSRKMLDELFKNHKNQGYSEKQVKLGYWTEETLQEEANKYDNICEFTKNSVGAYNAARKKVLLEKLFKNHINNGYIRTPNKDI